MMRMALAQALHHARHRTVFQKKLADQPMMRTRARRHGARGRGRDRADDAALPLVRSRGDAIRDEAARARLLTPAVKYWVCKTAPGFIYEAMECLGGNGYVEETLLARLYREAPVNAIWEGSGNVMCLDVLRALSREGEAARAVLAELVKACGGSAGREGGARLHRAEPRWRPTARRRRARRGRTARAAGGRRGAQPKARPEVAEAFARTRLAGIARRVTSARPRSCRQPGEVAVCSTAHCRQLYGHMEPAPPQSVHGTFICGAPRLPQLAAQAAEL